MQTQAAFIYSVELDQGGYPAACPFDTSRPGKTRERLASMGLLSGSDRHERCPDPVVREELEWFHDPAYLDVLSRTHNEQQLDERGMAMGLGTPDCPVFEGMYDYIRLAGGGALTGARALIDGSATIAFSPSGGFHHAMPGAAAGFCYINDVVLAAAALASSGRRVAFLDIDVHHCDGVQHAFYGRRDVMTISLHESGRTLFPGTGFEDEVGTGEGTGYSVNIPLPVATYDDAYLRAYRAAAFPVLKAFAPDVVVVEIGMDGLAGDPLAHLHLTNNVHAEVLESLLTLDCPILATGGGGYNVENTVRGWVLAWSVLCGDQSLHDDISLGMGGVMLENTDWSGGLRDRILLSDAGKRTTVDEALTCTLERVKSLVFPHHGLA